MSAFHRVRFLFGILPLSADRFLPLLVTGPVLSPPWSRQRPLSYRSLLLQGVPALVLAPQVKSGKGGIGGLGGMFGSLMFGNEVRRARHSS
jgi:hypothetical protein